jgi:hypothetical protein
MNGEEQTRKAMSKQQEGRNDQDMKKGQDTRNQAEKSEMKGEKKDQKSDKSEKAERK